MEKKPSWRALIEHNKMAVGLVDLSNPHVGRFASVNGYTMMYAASLAKIAVLLAVYQSIQDGSLKDSPGLHEWLVRMIRLSDNYAASYLIDLVGLKRIEQALLRYQFYVAAYGGGIWLGACYPPIGPRNPEPVRGLCHAATAMQLCRFYYMLAAGEIISPERSAQMLEILSKPGIHDKFVCVLEPYVSWKRLFRKSGEWNVHYSDSVLVWDHDCRKYILAALIDDKDGEQILRELVPVVEELLAPARIEARALLQVAHRESSQPGSKPSDASALSRACTSLFNRFHEYFRSCPSNIKDATHQ